MNQERESVIVASMQPRTKREWAPGRKKKLPVSKRRIVNAAAAAIGLSVGVAALVQSVPDSVSVMSHLETGFEYDETLGRLQYVSSVLPESAMVFLSGGESDMVFTEPTQTQIVHAWNQEEPWIEYASSDEILACQDGEVMTIVKNRAGEYTVRVLHDDGYESIYSGLTQVLLTENELVSAGETLGYASDYAAFELRKDGIAVLPVFDSL